MKRLLTLVFICIFVLAGCNSSDDSDKTTINILAQGVGDWDSKLVKVEEAYEAENPGVDVVIDYVSFNQVFEITEAELNAKSDKYDIFVVDGPYVASYADRGLLLPLDNYISSESMGKLTDSSLEAGTYKGQFYASPMNSSSQLLYYNKHALAAAGIEYPAEDERLSWEQVTEMTQKILDSDASEYGLLVEQIDRLYQINAFSESKGSETIGTDSKSVDGVWNSKEYIEGMEFYSQIFDKGISPKGFSADEQSALIDSMSYAFMWGGTWQVSKHTANGYTEEDFGYTLSPYFEGYEDQVSTPTGSWHVGINSYANDQLFEESAKFIQYLTIDEGNDIWLSQNNDVPSTRSAIDKIINDESYNSFPQSAQQLAAQEQLETASTRPVTPYFPQYETVVNQAFSDIRNGSNPKERMQQAVEQYNSVTKEE